MDTKANAGHIRNGTEEQVHKLIGLVEKHIDSSGAEVRDLSDKIKGLTDKGELATATELSSVKEQLERHTSTLKDVEDRLRNLDKVLPVGNKIYVPITAAETGHSQEVREQIARSILDAACVAQNIRPRFDSSMFRTQAEDPLADGGYLFNPEYRYEVVRIIEQYGVARRLNRQVRMASKEWKVPTSLDLPEVYWDMQIDGSNQTRLSNYAASGPSAPDAGELYAPAESKTTFGQRSMTAHKMIALDTLSVELSQDSMIDIQAFVLDQFAIAVSKEEDYQFLTSPGPSSEPFLGLLNNTNIASVVSEQTDYEAALGDQDLHLGAFAKLLKVFDSADEITAGTGTWVMSNSVLNAIRLIRTTNGEPLYAGLLGANGEDLFGRPIVRSRVMPKLKDAGAQNDKPFILFGDFNYNVMGDRQQLSFDSSPHAEFRRAGIVLRVMERIGFCNLSPAPFSKFKTAA